MFNFIEEVDNYYDEDVIRLRECTLEGKWKDVKDLYEKHDRFCTVNINKSRGTALHVAVNDGNVDVVESLVKAIVERKKKEALELKDERGDTPLHLAAARGFKEICELLIGEKGERKDLIDIDNNEGETPLFHAALSWQKQAFVYLFSFKPPNYSYSKDLIRNNGDSILHCAIRREFFDLALIIMDKYPDLVVVYNEDGFSPLKLLATRTSAFKSGCKLNLLTSIIYHCIPVRFLDIKKALTTYAKKEDDPNQSNQLFPRNYDTCCHFARKLQDVASGFLDIKEAKTMYAKKEDDPNQNNQLFSRNYDTSCHFTRQLQDVASDIKKAKTMYAKKEDDPDQNNQLFPRNYDTSCHFAHQLQDVASEPRSRKQEVRPHSKISMPEASSHELVPSNYATCLWFVKFACIYILGLSGVGVENIRKMKQKHKWSCQLLNLFMDKPNDAYFGSGAQPVRDMSGIDLIPTYKPGQGNIEHEPTTTSKTEPHKKKIVVSKTEKKETVILTAARHGIVEMVDELISKIPSVIHETNLENKNILLVAIENRRTLIVEALRKRFGEHKTKIVFDNLKLGVDTNENTMLHLAATRCDMNWHISGAALQMMWHIKWFQYVKELVPEHFSVRTNKEQKTAGEIFKESHAKLVEEGSGWLKDTSESCSVVAALLSGVSFATSSTVPGGNKSETGEPALEGKPAFDAFAIASVIGLCFSVTALVMFLAILTSRKEAKDFRIDLPRKLLLGLTSLFLSIVAMFTAFCSGHIFLIERKFKHVVFLIYTVTCLPVSLYAVAQLPLYLDLLKGILTKVPQTSDKGEDL